MLDLNENQKKHRREIVAKYRNKTRNEVFGHYGRVCSCGFHDMRALTIDHINGGGNKHRKEIKRGGCHFYVWLKQQGFPQGFQVMCMNCQFIKRHTNRECY